MFKKLMKQSSKTAMHIGSEKQMLFLSRTYTSFTQLAGTTPLPARLSTSHHPSP